MKCLLKGMLVASLVVSATLAKDVVKVTATKTAKKAIITPTSVGDIEIFTAANPKGKITPKQIEEAFKKAGFTVSANRDMNGPFKKQFKSSGFDTFHLFTFYKKEAVLELVKKYPNVGLFAPMSMSIYTKTGDKTISVSSLTVEAMAKIMKAPKEDKTLLALRALVKKTLKSVMPQGSFENAKHEIQTPQGSLVTEYTMEMDAKDWDEELEDLKMSLEGEIAPNGFVIAGFNNLGDEFEESKYEVYDFYEVYSICKLPVIYTIAKTRPEAGAYAPCSLYLYKKKNDKMMHIGFPSVYNWISSMAIKDTEEIKVLEAAQKGMNKILKSLTE